MRNPGRAMALLFAILALPFALQAQEEAGNDPVSEGLPENAADQGHDNAQRGLERAEQARDAERQRGENRSESARGAGMDGEPAQGAAGNRGNAGQATGGHGNAGGGMGGAGGSGGGGGGR